ncbi:MAG: N-acetylmuramoyl-L-alanine amidase [Armatimonadetes bacterium]|nr:N-acetylmuramoyl-L-alanine amidase [Armatimonadota bacterium]
MNRIAFLCLLPLFVVRPAVCAPQTPVPAPSPSPVAPLPDKQPPETPDYSAALWELASPSNFQSANRPSAERPINIIVMHDIEGEAMSAVRWFQNPQSQVSSHYVVDSVTGVVYQQVKERDVAWHAGNRNINGRSVGIEQGGFAYRPGFFTPALYESSARLVRDISTRHAIPRDRAHIIGHFEVPDASDPTKFGGRGGHTDPGPYFDWDYFMTLVRNDSERLSPGFSTNNNIVTNWHAPIVLRPGETGIRRAMFINRGDDPWLSDRRDAQDVERRKQGIVYLGAVGDTTSPLHSLQWLSPQYVAAVPADLMPIKGVGTPIGEREQITEEQSAAFTVPLSAPLNRLGRVTQRFRLVKVLPAPFRPVPFGEETTLFVEIRPWDVTVPLPSAVPVGWNTKPAPKGLSLLWSKTNAKNAPLVWDATLPVGGEYDVYTRSAPNENRTSSAVYIVNGEKVVINQRISGQIVNNDYGDNSPNAEANRYGWHKLGRFAFNETVPVAAPTPGAKPTFDAVAKKAQPGVTPVRATVTLSGSAGKPGIIAAGAVRFVGPFPKP